MEKKELISAITAADFTPWYDKADEIRRETKGDYVELRALLEISNVCRCDCIYCGLRAGNKSCTRYRMEYDEIIETGVEAAKAGYKTLVIQSGEDPWYTVELVGAVVRELKQRTGMAITLSLGERDPVDYAYWALSGADRYLMKHETADASLYAALHPEHTLEARVESLRTLQRLGYEVGSGFMIGIPGQIPATIADDLLLLRDLRCDMAGIGPYIPHPDTPLGVSGAAAGSAELTMRAVALARILLPEANLPATTALGVVDATDKRSVFDRGANVVMRKVTPDKYKRFYEIYPANLGKTDIFADRKALEDEITALGRIPR